MNINIAVAVGIIVSLAACGEVTPGIDAIDAAVDAIDAAVDAPIDAPPGADPTVTVTRTGSGGGTISSSVGGINCGAACTAQVASGTVMVLTAATDASSAFAGWSGACTGTAPSCTLTVTADAAVGAAFDVARRSVSVAVAGNGLGTVTAVPVAIGLSCPGTCSVTVDHGAAMTLAAAPQSGSVFLGWSGSGCTGSADCSLTVDGDKAINASFALSQTLVVTRTGTGTGTVTSNPVGINCGADCNETYSPGTMVTLSATPGANSTFTGWSGGGCTGTGGCVVAVSAAVSVNAAFTLNQHILTVTRAGAGTGTVTSNPVGINCGADCSELYNAGTSVTLTASAASGSSFTGWSGSGCTGTGTCVVTVTAAATVTATFMPIQHTLTVVPAGTGTGTVTASPTGINCGADCSEAYLQGTVVVLTATAAGNSTFAGWSGGGCTGSGTCTVTMSAATTVTATFNMLLVAPNIAFVTSSMHTGNLGGLTGADAICATRASAAGLPGTYRAFLSTPTVSAISRLGTASGWVRTDGKPFARTPTDLAAGRIFYPLANDEGGVSRPFFGVWSGTNPQGLSNDAACGNWTNTNGSGITGGSTNAGTGGWVFATGNSCTARLAIYCFGVDRTATLTVTPTPGRRIFITNNFWAPGGGIASADTACQSDATAAGLTGTYRALLATSTASAMSRFTANGQTWVRPDGIAVTATAAAFFGTTAYETPPSTAANGTTYFGQSNMTVNYLWSGATTMTAVGTAAETCNNWTATTATGVLTGAIATTLPSDLFGSTTFNSCSSQARLVCLQQ